MVNLRDCVLTRVEHRQVGECPDEFGQLLQAVATKLKEGECHGLALCGGVLSESAKCLDGGKLALALLRNSLGEAEGSGKGLESPKHRERRWKPGLEWTAFECEHLEAVETTELLYLPELSQQ